MLLPIPGKVTPELFKVMPALLEAKGRNSDGEVVSPSGAAVLVLDDEPLVLTSAKEILAREGFRVDTAEDPLEALEQLKTKNYSIIFADQRLPSLQGLEFLARAGKLQPDSARVLMTGVVEMGLVIDALNQGEIFRFIVKPWLREELVATAKNGAQRFELIRRNRDLQRSTVEMNERLVALNRSLEVRLIREEEQNRQLAALHGTLEQHFNHSIEVCIQTMQVFDPVLGPQARRTYALCAAMAEGLRLDSKDRQALEMSAWLHDIGLIGVPRSLIRTWRKSPKLLKESELKLIHQHPALGQDLAGFVNHLADVGSIVRAHHERFDGTGFPDGLAGQQIPWLGRLLAVAVAFAETGVSDWDPTALEAIKSGSGSAFDPEAVRIFLRFKPHVTLPQNEREILLQELESGMILARSIYAANGLLLIPEGKILNDWLIEKLQNHNRTNPIAQSLMVYC